MTLPRELSVRDGRLIQNPVRELERFRGTQVLHRNVRLSGTASLDGVQGRVLDMTVSVRPAPRAARYRSFRIDVAADTERRVLHNLLDAQQRTVIIVTHRMAAVDYCTQVVNIGS